MSITLISLNSQATEADDDVLRRVEAVHRQLRPHLPSAYAERMRAILRAGAEMLILLEDGACQALAVFRFLENTASGRTLYVDDLVTDAARRSSGHGKRLLNELERIALQHRCQSLSLDSGTHRSDAHRFYFRERMSISSFHFVKPLRTD
jgi:GNAT superfamily N-acetyltransferase